jgi:hypothetical protein
VTRAVDLRASVRNNRVLQQAGFMSVPEINRKQDILSNKGKSFMCSFKA